MINKWEICVLVYDYLQKSGFKETSLCFNNECPSLRLSNPPPNIFTCVLEKLLTNGDLESRLKASDGEQKTGQPETEKLKDLEKEVLHIRKRLKKRKRHSSDHNSKKKHRKLDSLQESNRSHRSTTPSFLDQQNSSLFSPSSQFCVSASENNANQQTQNSMQSSYRIDSTSQSSQVNQADTSEIISRGADVLTTPEKRLSSSRRKTATPKKYNRDETPGSLVQTLTDNINAKNEEAALDTLNSVEPWLEQFISSLSETPDLPESTSLDPPQLPLCSNSFTNPHSTNEEAAMSLLALNQTAGEQVAATAVPSAQSLNPAASESVPSSNIFSISNHVAQPESIRTLSTNVADVMLSQQSDNFAALENRTVMTTSQASVSTAAQSTAQHHLPSPLEQAASPIISSVANVTGQASISSQPNSAYDGMSFDPIIIKNQKTFSMAKNNPNLEIIVLPPIHTQHQYILPKPSPTPDPVPASFHVSDDVVAPVYNFVKSTPQQEAQKFFGQMRRPYHQQLSQIDQLYLVDRSDNSAKAEVSKTATKKKSKIKNEVKTPVPENASLPEDASVKSETEQSTITPDTEPVTSTSTATKSKDSFISWDQKIRQSIAETDFKTPPPPPDVKKKKKKKKGQKEEDEGVKKKKKGQKDRASRISKGKPSSVSDDSVQTDGHKESKSSKKEKKKKRRKKDGDETKDENEKSSSKIKKKKKKRDKEKEAAKKPPITPEFVNESLSSGEEDSINSNPRVRHLSESDSVMAENLLKSFNNNSMLPKSPQNCSTPVTSKVGNPLPSSGRNKVADTLKPSFIEENANSSFDIDESSRPKPVFIPEGSQNSCSCHSTHYKDSHKNKCHSSKTFSFKDQENADSPKNYNEDSYSSITVASLFPTISSSSISTSPKTEIKDRNSYRDQKEEDESENEQEDAASDDEIREPTSKLPPVSSQEKDLLDSSDEEQNSRNSKIEESELFPVQNTSKSVALSESDADSPYKKSPIKSPKLKLVPVMKKERLTSPQKPASTKGDTIISPEEIPVSAEHVVGEKSKDVTTEIEENGDLPSFQIADDVNESQELVIDGDEVASRDKSAPDIRVTSRSKSARLSLSKRRNSKSRKKSVEKSDTSSDTAVENNKNSENSIISPPVEDSCDTWYQNVENRVFKPKSSFTCEICKKSFPSQAVLTVHSETCSKTFLVCSNCGRKCTSKSGLTLHRKTCLNLDTPKSKDRRKSSGDDSKIKISPSSSQSGSQKKPLKKKKAKGGHYIQTKDIDEFLGNLRYQ